MRNGRASKTLGNEPVPFSSQVERATGTLVLGGRYSDSNWINSFELNTNEWNPDRPATEGLPKHPRASIPDRRFINLSSLPERDPKRKEREPILLVKWAFHQQLMRLYSQHFSQ